MNHGALRWWRREELGGREWDTSWADEWKKGLMVWREEMNECRLLSRSSESMNTEELGMKDWFLYSTISTYRHLSYLPSIISSSRALLPCLFPCSNRIWSRCTYGPAMRFLCSSFFVHEEEWLLFRNLCYHNFAVGKRPSHGFAQLSI